MSFCYQMFKLGQLLSIMYLERMCMPLCCYGNHGCVVRAALCCAALRCVVLRCVALCCVAIGHDQCCVMIVLLLIASMIVV